MSDRVPGGVSGGVPGVEGARAGVPSGVSDTGLAGLAGMPGEGGPAVTEFPVPPAGAGFFSAGRGAASGNFSAGSSTIFSGISSADCSADFSDKIFSGSSALGRSSRFTVFLFAPGFLSGP